MSSTLSCGGHLTAARVARLRADLAVGRATVPKVADRYGVSPTTVEHAAYGWTWRSVASPPPLAPPPPRVPVQSAATTVLTDGLVAQMRREYRAGTTTLGRLARELGVAESTVRAVMGRSWRHVAVPPVERAAVGGWTVLTVQDEEIILQRRSAVPPASYRAIAVELGQDVGTVFRAHRRLTSAGDARS